MSKEIETEAELFRFIEDYIWYINYDSNGVWNVGTVEDVYYGRDLRKVLMDIRDEIQ